MPMPWLFVLLTFIHPAQKSAPAAPATAVTRAGWITGCWESFGKGVPPLRLTWTAASNDLMVGRTAGGYPGQLTDFVFFRIESGSGMLSLVRQAAGEAPERFALDAGAPAGELAFVGGPPEARKRIAYRRDPQKGDQFVLRYVVDGATAVETPMKKDGCR